MAWRYCYGDLAPFVAMVGAECINVGLNTLFKAATMRGNLSYYVFVVYSYALAALILLPSPFFSHRIRGLPPLNTSILTKILVLGLIGSASQIVGYKGIKYSSPMLASALSNLIPAFTFILAILFRMEKVAWKSSSGQAKVLGTIISISGAFVVTLYKGPTIILIPSQPSISLLHQLPVRSAQSNWIIGGVCLGVEYFLVPLWYIVQAQIMKEYPSELVVVFFYNLSVATISASVGFFAERDLNAWMVTDRLALLAIICSGLFGSFLANAIHSWGLRIKGPLYVSMFKPLSIVIAVVMGVMLLGDALYAGSIVGAMIISFGFYSVMWGKSKEDTGHDCEVESLESPPTQKKPLLQDCRSEDT